MTADFFFLIRINRGEEGESLDYFWMITAAGRSTFWHVIRVIRILMIAINPKKIPYTYPQIISSHQSGHQEPLFQIRKSTLRLIRSASDQTLVIVYRRYQPPIQEPTVYPSLKWTDTNAMDHNAEPERRAATPKTRNRNPKHETITVPSRVQPIRFKKRSIM